MRPRPPRYFPHTLEDNTESFVRAGKLYDHLIQYHLGEYIGDAPAKPGDLIFMNLHGPADINRLTHAEVVTKVVGRHIWVAPHTFDYNKPFSKVREKQDRLKGPDNWAYWKVRPVHTAANIE